MPVLFPISPPAFWSGSGASFLARPSDQIEAALAAQQVRHFRTTEAEQIPAWRDAILTLRETILALANPEEVHVLLEYSILRFGRRIDAVILSPDAIFVLEFKRDQADETARRQVDDYALDLFDFHTASRAHPLIPILVTGGALRAHAEMPLFCGVTPVLTVHPANLPFLFSEIMHRVPQAAEPLTAAAWLAGTYAPVPTIVEAACMAYARNGVTDIAEARADCHNLRETTAEIWSAITSARQARRLAILFITGIPGAGKTLCGLNAAFAPDDAQRGTFLTGNPTLVHVLREALVRDAIKAGGNRHVVSRRMHTVIQRLPDFRTHYLANPHEAPPEPVVVIDEAQRCWSCAHAIRKTRDKPLQLTDSEPGHLLDIMARRADFAVLVCMAGGGQEIHDGEGGLAEWGAALRARPDWHVFAAPETAGAPDARQRLGHLPNLRANSALHLNVPIRQIRGSAAARWVDALLAGDRKRAAAIAHDDGPLPFAITRSRTVLRTTLRAAAHGTRRAGLLASSGAARLRAEGFGAELPHMDANAVARWFLDHFPPDIRASGALEQLATEFSVQGLELDYVGLCWDADLLPDVRHGSWVARRFAGTKWQVCRSVESVYNRINTYRVLLTRARYHTTIYIPRGDACDPTRDPTSYDAIATFLEECGLAPIAKVAAALERPAIAPARLL